MNPTRRTILKSAALAALATPALLRADDTPATPSSSPHPTSQPAVGFDRFRGLRVGVATYTFRQKPLQPTIDAIRRVGCAYCSIKDFHLPLKSTKEQREQVSNQFRAAGITPLSCGNISIRSEADARQAFEYARDASIPTIVCAPTIDALPILDKLVKEFDIKIAIHNHGPEDKYFPSPLDVWKHVQDLDPRVGLCVDIGHCFRAGVNPADAILQCAPRVYDSHIKDVATHSPKSPPIECGRGVIDLKAVFAAFLQIKMTGHIGFEHEIQPADPLAGLAEDVGFTRGVLATLPT